jgi:hypothetical protein
MQNESEPRAHKPSDFVAATLHLFLFILVTSAMLGYNGTQPYLGEDGAFSDLVHDESRFGTNPLGSTGALLGAVLFNYFGLAAFILPLFLFAWMIMRMSLRPFGLGRFFGFMLALFVFALSFAAISTRGDYSPLGGGGVIGQAGFDKLASIGCAKTFIGVGFGIFGCMVLLVTLIHATQAAVGIFDDYRMITHTASQKPQFRESLALVLAKQEPVRTFQPEVIKEELRERHVDESASPQPEIRLIIPAAIPLTDQDIEMGDGDEGLTEEVRKQLGKGLTFSLRQSRGKKDAAGHAEI